MSFELGKCGDQYVMFATSFDSSLGDRAKIRELVDRSGIKNGVILVDLLLSRGNSYNRYTQLYIESYSIFSISIAIDVDKSIKKLSLDFYNENQEMLKGSILTPFVKKCIQMKRMF